MLYLSNITSTKPIQCWIYQIIIEVCEYSLLVLDELVIDDSIVDLEFF